MRMRIHNATCWCVMAFLFEVFCRRWPNVTSGAIDISKYWYPLILELNSSFQIHLNLHFFILHVNWVGWEMFQKSFGTQVFLCCKLSLIEVETCKDKNPLKMNQMNQIWERKIHGHWNWVTNQTSVRLEKCERYYKSVKVDSRQNYS